MEPDDEVQEIHRVDIQFAAEILIGPEAGEVSLGSDPTQYTDDDGNQIPTTNVGLWGGSNGPVYERRSMRLWSVYYFEIGLLCLLLVGLAEPRVLHVRKATDLPYFVFLDRVISWRLAPPLAVTKRIVEYLATRTPGA